MLQKGWLILHGCASPSVKRSGELSAAEICELRQPAAIPKAQQRRTGPQMRFSC